MNRKTSIPALPLPTGWTSAMPLACAAHCTVTPVLVAAAPSLRVGPELEWALLLATVALAATTLGAGVTRREGLRPALLVVGGISLWGASLLQAFQPLPEDVSTPIAAFTAAAGLIWTSRVYRSSDKRYACSASDEGVDPAHTFRGKA